MMEDRDRITVVLIDDHALMRKGVARLLEDAPDLEVVGQAGNFSEATTAIDGLHPDVVLLDLQLPDTSGADLCMYIKKASPDTKILILSAFLNQNLLKLCLSLGASGYLVKDAENLDLAASIRMVANGGTVFDRRTSAVQMEYLTAPKSAVETITPKELEVVRLVSRGLTNREIADKLGISLNTVKGYMVEIMRKMDCRNRVEVVMAAQENYML